MRVLTFTPGIARPCIQHIACAPDTLRRVIGGPFTARHVPEIMQGAILLYSQEAAAPNRIVDGQVIYGAMLLARLKHGELVDLPLTMAEHVRDNCKWPQAQWAEAVG